VAHPASKSYPGPAAARPAAVPQRYGVGSMSIAHQQPGATGLPRSIHASPQQAAWRGQPAAQTGAPCVIRAKKKFSWSDSSSDDSVSDRITDPLSAVFALSRAGSKKLQQPGPSTSQPQAQGRGGAPGGQGVQVISLAPPHAAQQGHAQHQDENLYAAAGQTQRLRDHNAAMPTSDSPQYPKAHQQPAAPFLAQTSHPAVEGLKHKVSQNSSMQAGAGQTHPSTSGLAISIPDKEDSTDSCPGGTQAGGTHADNSSSADSTLSLPSSGLMGSPRRVGTPAEASTDLLTALVLSGDAVGGELQWEEQVERLTREVAAVANVSPQDLEWHSGGLLRNTRPSARQHSRGASKGHSSRDLTSPSSSLIQPQQYQQATTSQASDTIASIAGASGGLAHSSHTSTQLRLAAPQPEQLSPQGSIGSILGTGLTLLTRDTDGGAQQASAMTVEGESGSMQVGSSSSGGMMMGYMDTATHNSLPAVPSPATSADTMQQAGGLPNMSATSLSTGLHEDASGSAELQPDSWAANTDSDHYAQGMPMATSSSQALLSRNESVERVTLAHGLGPAHQQPSADQYSVGAGRWSSPGFSRLPSILEGSSGSDPASPAAGASAAAAAHLHPIDSEAFTSSSATSSRAGSPAGAHDSDHGLVQSDSSSHAQVEMTGDIARCTAQSLHSSLSAQQDQGSELASLGHWKTSHNLQVHPQGSSGLHQSPPQGSSGARQLTLDDFLWAISASNPARPTLSRVIEEEQDTGSPQEEHLTDSELSSFGGGG
jgi:hypothetical protein